MSDTVKNLSRNLTDQLISGGIALSIKEDSLIAPIVGELLRPMESIETDSVEALIKHTNAYFESNTPNPFAPSMESEVVGNSVSIGVDAVLNDLKPIAVGIVETVRSNVLPAVNTIFERAYDTTSETVDRGGVLVSIETDGSENPIWKNPALAALVADLNEASELGDNYITKLVFPNLPFESLNERLHSVNNILNESIDTLLGDCAEKVLTSVYSEKFNTGGVVDTSVRCERLKNLIGLLLGISFREDIPDGVTGVDDAGQYRAILDSFVDGCILHLVRAHAYTESITKSGRLVLEFPPQEDMFKGGAKILVNGFIYESWLEAGGSVDAIFGAYVSNTQPRNGADILANKPQLEREWVRRVGLAQSTLRDDFERVFTNELRREIYKYADEVGLKVDEKGIEKMYERTSSIDSHNCYGFARRAVVACLFADGDYLSVLEEVDAISAKVPGIELEDAIDLAIIDWLVGWALSMVNIKRA